MPRAIAWRSLLPGLLIPAAVLVVASLILFRARMGGLSGRTFQLYVTAPDATGLAVGGDVWLAGQRVGEVERIAFRPPTIPANARVLIQLDMLERARQAIRADSRVQIENGGTVIGVRVLYLTFGTSGAPMVHQGDTLQVAAGLDVGATVARAGDALHQVPSVVANLRLAAAQAAASESTVASMIDRTTKPRATAHSASVAHGANLGMARYARLDTQALAAMRAGAAATDSIQSRARSRGQSLEGVAQDSALASAVRRFAADRAVFQSVAQRNDGTLGRYKSDTVVRAGVATAGVELRALLADMKTHPLRYFAPF